MTVTHEKQKFELFHDDGRGLTFADLVFRKCSFESCSLSVTKDPAKRSTVRNVQLIGCSTRSCGIWCPILDEVVVDGLKTAQLLQAWGAAYRHVTLKGKIGRVMLSPVVDIDNQQSAVQAAFDKANAKFYEDVDWALDIREAEVEELDIRGLPARLVKRDRDTQAVVKREKALRGAHRTLDLGDTILSGSIDMFLRGEPNQWGDELIIVAGKRAKDFKATVRGIELLRKAGVAEPD